MLFFTTIMVMITTASALHNGESCMSCNHHQSNYCCAEKRRSNFHPIPKSDDFHDQNGFACATGISRGGGYLPAGWNPFGYAITDLGLEYLKFEGSLDSDIGRFLASLKSGRKKRTVLREQWVEIVRVSKTGQSMRILRKLDDLIDFCIQAGFLK